MDVEAGAVDGVLVVLAPVAGHVPAVIRNLNSGHDRLGWSAVHCCADTALYPSHALHQLQAPALLYKEF